MAWKMDEDSRFLDRAVAELDAVCAFSDWNPSHFLDLAEMSLAVSIGYDWLYNVPQIAGAPQLVQGHAEIVSATYDPNPPNSPNKGFSFVRYAMKAARPLQSSSTVFSSHSSVALPDVERGRRWVSRADVSLAPLTVSRVQAGKG